MPALHDVQRCAIKMDARAAGHGASKQVDSRLATLTLAQVRWSRTVASLDFASQSKDSR
jgi:hypothetical protein